MLPKVRWEKFARKVTGHDPTGNSAGHATGERHAAYDFLPGRASPSDVASSFLV
jgi:hypothetical protein